MGLSDAVRVLQHALHLRCPRCGGAAVFEGWFAMRDRCAGCRLVFEREPGYFVGAIYVNYALTVAVIIVGYLLVDSAVTLGVTTHILLWSLVAIACPLACFRHARCLWLGVAYVLDPEPPDAPRRS